MEYKLLAMGTLTKILVIKLVILTLFAKSQIVRIENSDQYKLAKIKELNEDGLSFYKDEYSLAIYSKENIKYNKVNGYRPKTFAGGKTFCDKCKKEVYFFRVKKNKDLDDKKHKIYSTAEMFRILNNFSLGIGYFLIDGQYYKNLGIPLE